jgi:hypothetical protein
MLLRAGGNLVQGGMTFWLIWRWLFAMELGSSRSKITSFALTSRVGYVEMHKLMFSDAEIFS